MRISKPPEVRKQEIIDTAMQVFAKKGYEATTVSAMARKMNVVSGLFYKYFSSKDINSIIMNIFSNAGSAQQYHIFFRGKENELFHEQLNL